MNVYDFDQTIYRGDSTVDFYFYCLRRRPRMLRRVPGAIGGFALYGAKRWDKTRAKQQMYRFLTEIGDTEQLVREFWRTHIRNIKPWYIEKTRRADDVVISASPEFLLRPACEQLGIRHLMASRVDAHTGRYTGVNCWGEEKVRRFREVFGDARIETFYSDSLSDTPLAREAQTAWIVRGDALIPWAEWEKKKHRRA
ncbi:MAG TPA: HAD-IB family phosphatase [Candidatus Butyricicoccus stercorigallinarum]|nr:HAD-IB family phosphatase [Candidatus Butyricicoccus stercorigallinarum]